MQKTFTFDDVPITPAETLKPKGYVGLYGLHKYWGKKPHEPIAYLIEQLTDRGQLVVDPFLGSGTAARESVIRGRRFIGFDVNPVAVELAQFLTAPAEYEETLDAFQQIEGQVKSRIHQSYVLEDGATATHYLWEKDVLKQVWIKGNAGVARRESEPSQHDLKLYDSFAGYQSRFIRCPTFFSNGRINASPNMTLESLLTPRAQRNIDLLIEAIGECPPQIRSALRVCLTAASGQMTRMVFAVTGRGKTTGKMAGKVEVGSWVIGYWRPTLHFEVNVWNCFENRARKMLKAIKSVDRNTTGQIAGSVQNVVDGKAAYRIELTDCRKAMEKMPAGSVALIITDPPHSDRVPYLELSEFWNSLLGKKSVFGEEIVISNAKERDMSEDVYQSSMRTFFRESARILSEDGHLVVLFNAREKEAWEAIHDTILAPVDSKLNYAGCFPCNYSANSVVQDNRKGAMKSDWALVFSRKLSDGNSHRHKALGDIPGWTPTLPEILEGVT
jgi:hypothetical protein